MSAWFHKNLGDAMMAFEALAQIEALFESAYRPATRPKQAAVFIRHVSEGSLHCQVEVYFSPASELLAKKVGADPCDPPVTDGLGLLVGSEDSWSALFPASRS